MKLHMNFHMNFRGRLPGDLFSSPLPYTDLRTQTDTAAKAAERKVGYEEGVNGTGIYSRQERVYVRT